MKARAAIATAVTLAAGAVLLAEPAEAVDAWTRRMFDDQNTTNVGDDPKLTPQTVPFLAATAADVVRTDGCSVNPTPQVNHTPIVSDGLLFFGDWCGHFYVVDLEAGRKKLIRVDTGTGGAAGGALGTYVGVQATPVLATLSTGERRLYFGANDQEKTLWCLDLDAILADRETLRAASGTNPGTAYQCSGTWPKSLAAVPVSGNERVLNGSPMFRAGQTITRTVDGSTVTDVHDVLFVPSTGLDCANGQFYAMDAVSGERLWIFDPVELGNGQGGTIWTMPAMNREGTALFLTTGDCVQKPQVGEKAESLVALDPETGEELWFHQRRLIDTQDFDIGNAPTLADVDLNDDGDSDDPGECRVVVSTDKDGCIYGFRQERDVPEIGDLGFDPLRPGQQRILWRTCFVPGSLGGGFDAATASVHGRYAFAQAKSAVGTVPGDDANAFAVDACTGEFQWATSSIGKGWGEGAVASGMFFQPDGPGMQMHVVAADAGENEKATLLASVMLPGPVAPGGGGPAIVDGAIYLPGRDGVVIVSLGDLNGAPASPPTPRGNDSFKGPYPLPLAPAVPPLVVDPDDPYPLDLGLD